MTGSVNRGRRSGSGNVDPLVVVVAGGVVAIASASICTQVLHVRMPRYVLTVPMT